MMGRGGGEGGKVPNRECLIGQVGQVRRVRQVGRPSDAGATTNRTSSAEVLLGDGVLGKGYWRVEARSLMWRTMLRRPLERVGERCSLRPILSMK